MKLKSWARVLLAVAPFIAGCKGFWDVPSGSGSGGGQGNASGVFYVLNQKAAQVAGFAFPANSTALTAVTNGLQQLNAAPFAAAFSPNGAFLYVSTAAGIFVYSVNSSNGSLTILNSGNVISQDPAVALALDPSGSWLIDGVSGLGVATVNAIPLIATTGLPESGAVEQPLVLPAGATVAEIATTVNGAANPYVFVAMGASGLGVAPFNSASTGNPFGKLSVVNPKNSGGGDNALAVDLTNPVLYVGETAAVSDPNKNTGGLRMFAVGANSSLTEVSGSPYATGGIGPSAILPTTHYVYVANRSVNGSNNGNITAFAITTVGTASSLTAITNGTTSKGVGVGTVGLAEDSTGTYVLAVNSGGSPDLNAFTISSTGALTSYATGSTASSPAQAVAIVAVP